MLNITILGSGAWGIGLGLTLYRAQHSVTLWTPFSDECTQLKKNRRHPKIMPDIQLPEKINITDDLEQALNHANLVLCVTPAQTMRAVAQQCKLYAKSTTTFMSCSKGIDVASGLFLTEILKSELPHHMIGTIAGPNFAHEVALNLPAQAVLALPNWEQAQDLAITLSHKHFHFIPLQDVRGIELAGAIKNILAIGAGIIVGAGLGENARAAYLTKGLQDLHQLGHALKCNPATFISVGAIGDIFLTCLSATSRNMKFGLDVGSGQIDVCLDINDKPLTEGIYTVKAIKHIMEKHALHLPSIMFVEQIVYEKQTITDAFLNLKL